MKQDNEIVEIQPYVIQYVFGGGKCLCRREPTAGELRAHSFGRMGGEAALLGKLRLWEKDTPTKSNCIHECCEVTGGYTYRYGAAHLASMC